jgi:hypothetical protein
MTLPSATLYAGNLSEQAESMKVCKKCSVPQILENFNRSKRTKDGHSNQCKTCTAEYFKKWEAEKLPQTIFNPNELRVCSKCGILQPVICFDKNARGRDGLRSQCRQCMSASRKRAWKEASQLLPHLNHRQSNKLKICSTCCISQPIDNFYNKPTAPDGLYTRCKSCVSKESQRQRNNNLERRKKQGQEWSKNNRERKVKSHKEWIAKHPKYYSEEKKDINFKRFGVNREWYEVTLADQNSGCAICGSTIPGGVGRFHIDHNHRCCSERKACDKCRRGLLCSACNLKLGWIENEVWFEKATAYLDKYRNATESLGCHT